jgi:glycerol uptake facilitator-like aquaporin
MVRVLIGSFVGGVAMFIVGFILWATPLQYLGYSTATDAQNAAVQLSLAQNLPHTGRYIVPNPASQVGGNGYTKGPIASVDYNSSGFSTSDPATMIGGFIQEVIVSLMIGLSLLAVASRVTDFESRARLAIGLSAAAVMMIRIGDPIWMHADWRFAIYALIADLAMLSASSLVIARWFLPRAVVAETVH